MALWLVLLLMALDVVSPTSPPPPVVGNYTKAQLQNALSKVVIESIRLKAENADLKTKLSECQTERFVKEKKLNTTLDNHANCSDVKSRLDSDNLRLMTKLDSCEKMKDSLLGDLVVNVHTLNISHQEKLKCMGELSRCKTALTSFLSSCKAWYDAGFTKDGVYIIDPDGPGGVDHFEVECDMVNYYGEPITIVHHDSEQRTNAGNSEAAYTNVRDVKYMTSIPQIVKLIGLSSNCEQYIKYECLDSHITGYATWYSRDGTPMYYWGGAKPGSGKCACGMTNSCDTPGEKCNCNAYTSQWRSDAGLLTDKTTLPVTRMAFGDLSGSHEEGFFRLGALQCYGVTPSSNS